MGNNQNREPREGEYNIIINIHSLLSSDVFMYINIVTLVLLWDVWWEKKIDSD